jgi:protein subunit release factor B
MVKDHRTGHESSDPEKVLEGGLDDFIDAMAANGLNPHTNP